MPRRSVLEADPESEINLSPMIDCIFILLIFFIVTTVFVEEQGLQVQKPDSAGALSTENDENVTLRITETNRILLGEQEIMLADVPTKVRAALSDPETPVVIQVHEKAANGLFVGVWDAAVRAGAQALSFSTQN